MLKLGHKQNTAVGYSSRHKKPAAPLVPLNSQLNPVSQRIKSEKTNKLPVISQGNIKPKSDSPKRRRFQSSIITRPIEEKSKDYETAIKDHLGIISLSRESSFSDVYPAKRLKPTPRMPTTLKSVDLAFTNDLAEIEQQETRITNSIKNLKKGKKKSIVVKPPSNLRNTDLEDKEIKLIQDSLNKINSLLNRILHKPAQKNK